MIGAIVCLLVIALASPTHEQSTPSSPCPKVFSYEPPVTEPGRWYGVINLSTDSTLQSILLKIVLDAKADILGNWFGNVTTKDNIEFKIENTKMKIHPGSATVRFFVKYNQLTSHIPRLVTIILNGRKICNANQLQIILPEINSGSSIPANSPESERPIVVETVERPRSYIQPEKTFTDTVHSGTASLQSQGPVYVPTSNPQISDIYVNHYSINADQVPGQSVNRPGNNYRLTTASYPRTTSTESSEIEYFDYTSNPDPSDYFGGGIQIFVVPKRTDNGLSSDNKKFRNDDNNNGNRNKRYDCGKVTLPNLLVVNGKPTLEGQWPWHIALYQYQGVNNIYLCGGTLLNHLNVITAAHCVTLKDSKRAVNKNTLTIYLGKHNLRTSVNGVQIQLVSGISVHPKYNGVSHSDDLAILTMREAIQYTNYVRPICLWPANLIELDNIIEKTGSVVGWGTNEKGLTNEELALVEMPVVSHSTCIESYYEFFQLVTTETSYCAGFRDGSSVCNGDSGGGMVFKIGDSWHLRGLVSLSVSRTEINRCDPNHFVVFTDLAKFLPWILENISDA